jgi:pilus assembly protein CpaF
MPPEPGAGGDDRRLAPLVQGDEAGAALRADSGGLAVAARTVHEALVGGGGGDIAELVRRRHPLASAAEVRRVVDGVLHRLGGLGAIQPLLDDPTVSEVMVNAPGERVWVERCGRLAPTEVVLDADAVGLVVERITAPLGLRVDRTRPLLDARLPDGSRVNIAVPPLAVDGPCITIRRFVARALPLAALCPPGVDELLARAVAERRNVLAVGGTGAGKTTLLHALAAQVPATERIVTVEDAAELDLGHPHVVRLEARGSASGGGATSAAAVRDLVRNALRMRPDRIVVGEVRGAEALDLLVAMNIGHDGTLSTVHANGAADALARLELMVLLAGLALPPAGIRAQLGASVDLVVHVARLAHGRRQVVEVAEVQPDGLGTRTVADASGVVASLTRPPRQHAPRASDGTPPTEAAR